MIKSKSKFFLMISKTDIEIKNVYYTYRLKFLKKICSGIPTEMVEIKHTMVWIKVLNIDLYRLKDSSTSTDVIEAKYRIYEVLIGMRSLISARNKISYLFLNGYR